MVNLEKSKTTFLNFLKCSWQNGSSIHSFINSSVFVMFPLKLKNQNMRSYWWLSEVEEAMDRVGKKMVKMKLREKWLGVNAVLERENLPNPPISFFFGLNSPTLCSVNPQPGQQ